MVEIEAYPLVLVGFLLAVLAISGLVLVMPLVFSSPQKGGHVVEIWLEWPLCTGSVMYRQRYRWRWMAMLDMRIRAEALDWKLPHFWRTTDWNGKVIRISYDFGIAYGIRTPTAKESREGICAVSTFTLPGLEGSTAEHREGHPVRTEFGGESPQALGFKV